MDERRRSSSGADFSATRLTCCDADHRRARTCRARRASGTAQLGRPRHLIDELRRISSISDRRCCWPARATRTSSSESRSSGASRAQGRRAVGGDGADGPGGVGVCAEGTIVGDSERLSLALDCLSRTLSRRRARGPDLARVLVQDRTIASAWKPRTGRRQSDRGPEPSLRAVLASERRHWSYEWGYGHRSRHRQGDRRGPRRSVDVVSEPGNGASFRIGAERLPSSLGARVRQWRRSRARRGPRGAARPQRTRRRRAARARGEPRHSLRARRAFGSRKSIQSSGPR